MAPCRSAASAVLIGAKLKQSFLLLQRELHSSPATGPSASSSKPPRQSVMEKTSCPAWSSSSAILRSVSGTRRSSGRPKHWSSLDFWLGELHTISIIDRKSTRLNSSHLVISYAV